MNPACFARKSQRVRTDRCEAWRCWITNRGRGETVSDGAVRLTLAPWGGLCGALASPSFYQPEHHSRKRPLRPARNGGFPRPKIPAGSNFYGLGRTPRSR